MIFTYQRLYICVYFRRKCLRSFVLSLW